ncbi:MAG: hypothetical protein IPG42_02495 [Betaproteobacteria bacterium]|nr:hypothetical protein [Betaproteobacteria bacterium]
MPDSKRNEAERDQTVQEVVSRARVEVRPDLCPRFAHEPSADGDVKTGHERRQEPAQHDVRKCCLQRYGWHQNHADREGKQGSGQRTELDSTLLSDSRDDELDPGNAMQSLRAS